ncbi:carbohydrate binding family 9 domain-containing protein [Spirosoma arcticum]
MKQLINTWKTGFFTVGFGLTSSALHAQTPDPSIFQPVQPPKQIHAVRATGPLTIDGRLNEADWQGAPATTGFFQAQPEQGKIPTNDTRIRVMFDNKNIYIGAFCPDSLGRRALRVPDLRRDFDYFANDLVGVSFDPFRDQRNAQAFQTNPFGAQRDLLCADDALFDRDWDGFWKVRTTRTDSGWVAEMQLPWVTLRYPRPDSTAQSWGVNFVRISRRINEQTYWSPVPRAYTVYRMTYAGLLTGLTPPPPSANIRVQPYVLYEYNRTLRNGATLAQNPRVTFGGELKWAITPQTVLDLTANTDFAQADADRQVQNLTRFSVFFPERRQFFLENASLFGVGQEGAIQPFFSRRIGLSDAGTPIPLDAGLRLVSRTLKQNVGALLVRQRATGLTPAASFAVGRFSRNYGEQNRIGGLITARFDEGVTEQNQPASTNLTASVDGFVRINQSLSWSYMVSGSTGRDGAENGVSAVSQLNFTNNQWVALYNQTLISERYTPGAGFIYAPNLINTYFEGYRMLRPRWRPKGVRQADPGATFGMYHRTSDRAFQQAELRIFPLYVIGVTGWVASAYVVPTWQRLDEGFAPLGIDVAAGRYYYTRYQLNFTADQSKKFSYELFNEWGGYYNGRLRSHTASVRYSPVPQASFALDYTRNIANGLGIEQQDRVTELITPNIRLALNPRLQLIGFYQKNTASQRDVWNVRLACEFQPLSFLYIVYNSNAQQQLQNSGLRPDLNRAEQVIGKLTYLKQF